MQKKQGWSLVKAREDDKGECAKLHPSWWRGGVKGTIWTARIPGRICSKLGQTTLKP